MAQHFTPWIKHPVNSRYFGLSSLFCREFQGVLLHPLRFCAWPHASLTADSNNQSCFGRFQQLFSHHEFCPRWEELRNLLFRAIFRHRGWDSIIPASFPSVGHSPFFSGLAWKLLRPCSLGYFLWKTKWLLRDNEGPVTALCACGGHRKTPS